MLMHERLQGCRKAILFGRLANPAKLGDTACQHADSGLPGGGGGEAIFYSKDLLRLPGLVTQIHHADAGCTGLAGALDGQLVQQKMAALGAPGHRWSVCSCG